MESIPEMNGSTNTEAPEEPIVTGPIDLTEKIGHRGSDRMMPPLLAACALFSGVIVAIVVVFVAQRAWPTFAAEGHHFLTHGGWDTQIEDALYGAGVAFFGAKPLILGTLYTTMGAVIISLVLGLGCAIFLAELSPRWARRPLESVVQLLAGIPSVVFGLVGLAVVVPFITDYVLPQNYDSIVTDIPLEGASLLAGILVLSFMILPFFVTVATDSLRAIPRSYVDGGLALGMTRWRTITRIQLPAAAPGVVAGIVLAAARGVGEAIALSMVAGAIAYSPTMAHGPLYFLLMPVRTMASAIVETGGEAMNVPSIGAALFALAFLLLLFSVVLSIIARWAFVVFNRRMGAVSGRKV
jgi:phosphate ABC transporter permease protein PstC